MTKDRVPLSVIVYLWRRFDRYNFLPHLRLRGVDQSAAAKRSSSGCGEEGVEKLQTKGGLIMVVPLHVMIPTLKVGCFKTVLLVSSAVVQTQHAVRTGILSRPRNVPFF